jgi:hypothetical protein
MRISSEIKYLTIHHSIEFIFKRIIRYILLHEKNIIILLFSCKNPYTNGILPIGFLFNLSSRIDFATAYIKVVPSTLNDLIGSLSIKTLT